MCVFPNNMDNKLYWLEQFLIGGKFPFSGSTDTKIMHAILNTTPAIPDEISEEAKD